MASKKIIVLFEAGPGTADILETALTDLARQTLKLPDAECRIVPAAEWDAVGSYHESDLEDPALKAALLQKQFGYFDAQRWELSQEAIAGAFRDMAVNTALQSLYFLYAFDRQRISEAEFKADRLYTAWVPVKNYQRPSLVLGAIALLVAGLPITFSLIYPDFLGAGWAILDIIAVWGAGTLLWRGVIRRFRKYPVEHHEHCEGCGHHNRLTSVVTFNCEKCGRDLSYELARDPQERAVRIRQVKCPYCDGINDLRYRRMMYTCQRCGVKQKSSKGL